MTEKYKEIVDTIEKTTGKKLDKMEKNDKMQAVDDYEFTAEQNAARERAALRRLRQEL